MYPSSDLQPRPDGKVLYSLWSVPYISAVETVPTSEKPGAFVVVAQWVNPKVEVDKWVSTVLHQS